MQPRLHVHTCTAFTQVNCCYYTYYLDIPHHALHSSRALHAHHVLSCLQIRAASREEARRKRQGQQAIGGVMV